MHFNNLYSNDIDPDEESSNHIRINLQSIQMLNVFNKNILYSSVWLCTKLFYRKREKTRLLENYVSDCDSKILNKSI